MSFPDLLIRPADRIAITGPNGAGKSTLVRHVLAHIELTPERIVVVPQELDRDAAVRIAGDVRAMEAGTLGKVMSAVALLGSDPRRILETDEPSAGEARKLLLALGMARTPNLIVMDEPTNHLDLPSIECLENALAECRCALLLVSHDLRFLARLTTSRWDLVRDEHDDTSLVTSAGTIPSLTSSEG